MRSVFVASSPLSARKYRVTRLSCVNNFSFDVGKSKKIYYAHMIGGMNKARRLRYILTCEDCEGARWRKGRKKIIK